MNISSPNSTFNDLICINNTATHTIFAGNTRSFLKRPYRRRAINREMRVLSVDFDYWYPGAGPVYAGHCGRCKHYTHYDEKQCRPDILEPPGVVSRRKVLYLIRVSHPLRMYVAESHADILGPIRDLRHGRKVQVFDIDHHEDYCKYNHDGSHPTYKSATCGNWVDALFHAGVLRRFQPLGEEDEWKKFRANKRERNRHFDMLFVCKSSPYLHPSGDRHFLRFLHSAGRYVQASKPYFVGHRWATLRRQYERSAPKSSVRSVRSQ